MDSLARAITTGVVCAAIAAGATAWIVTTHGRNGEEEAPARAVALPPEGLPAQVPVGDLAGAAETTLPNDVANPLQGDAAAVEEGQRLYDRMNCAGCHGYKAKGGMGPDLTDTHWRYGGTPVQIYKSIYEGRPKGMPAWGKALPSRSIWALTSFIQSLGGSFPESGYHAGLQGDLADENGQGSNRGAGKGKSGK